MRPSGSPAGGPQGPPAVNRASAGRPPREGPLDAAVLDADLRGGPSYTAADALAARGVPFAFLTGYEAGGLPDRRRGRPVLGKPYAADRLPAVLDVAAWEQGVRARAHAIWQREGRPVGEE